MTRHRAVQQNWLSYPLINLGLLTACVFVYYFIHNSYLAFVPLAVTAFFLGFAPVESVPAVLLTYVAFDGMLKVLSNYNPLIHVGADILVGLIIVRHLLMASFSRKGQFTLPPLWSLFVLHLMWVTLEILNPYGLGFIPGLAAYKVYASFVIMYFITYTNIKSLRDIQNLFVIGILIFIIEILSCLYQFQGGSVSMLALSQNYAKILKETSFIGSYFRPFGTSSNPGGGATWLFLSIPLTIPFLLQSKTNFKKAGMLILLIFAGFCLYVSQVRSALVKGIAGFALSTMFLYARQPRKLILGLAMILMFVMSFQLFLRIQDERLAVAKERFEALSSFRYIANARGNGVFESIGFIWENAPFGIGLSRTGAAGRVFREQISENQFFGTEWMFADNLYRAITVELGIPGSLLFLAVLYFPILLVVYRVRQYSSINSDVRFFLAGCVGMIGASILGHWGSEGSLYLPECAYYWIFLGAAVRISESDFMKLDDEA